MWGSSYIQLPAFIDNKRGTINPQNVDRQCFKWAILAKHVTGAAVCHAGENYTQHERKYNFEGITSPTPLFDISKFEKKNINVSVNVFRTRKKVPATEHLHNGLNDLPFLPYLKIRKLMATFETKKNYVIHYRNLQ